MSFAFGGWVGSASEVCHCLGGSQYRKDKRQPLHALGGRLGSLQVLTSLDSVAILAQERDSTFTWFSHPPAPSQAEKWLEISVSLRGSLDAVQ